MKDRSVGKRVIKARNAKWERQATVKLRKDQFSDFLKKTRLIDFLGSQAFSGSCQKVVYLSERDAQHALDLIHQMRLAGEDWRGERHYYQCRDCRLYHLTSKKPRRKDIER